MRSSRSAGPTPPPLRPLTARELKLAAAARRLFPPGLVFITATLLSGAFVRAVVAVYCNNSDPIALGTHGVQLCHRVGGERTWPVYLLLPVTAGLMIRVALRSTRHPRLIAYGVIASACVIDLILVFV